MAQRCLESVNKTGTDYTGYSIVDSVAAPTVTEKLIVQTLTRQEFEEGYAQRSGVTVEYLRKTGRISLPCNCEEDECQGWQMRSLRTLIPYDLQFIPEPYRSEAEHLLFDN